MALGGEGEGRVRGRSVRWERRRMRKTKKRRAKRGIEQDKGKKRASLSGYKKVLSLPWACHLGEIRIAKQRGRQRVEAGMSNGLFDK